jgi:hypothetical protein
MIKEEGEPVLWRIWVVVEAGDDGRLMGGRWTVFGPDIVG